VSNRIQMIVKAVGPVSRLYLAKDEDRKELITHIVEEPIFCIILFILVSAVVLSCGGIPLLFFFSICHVWFYFDDKMEKLNCVSPYFVTFHFKI